MVLLVQLALRVMRAQPDPPERRVQAAPPAQLDPLERRVRQAPPDRKEMLVRPAQQALPAPLAVPALLDPRAPRVILGRPVLRACRVFKASRVILAPPGPQDLPAQLVRQALRVPNLPLLGLLGLPEALGLLARPARQEQPEIRVLQAPRARLAVPDPPDPREAKGMPDPPALRVCRAFKVLLVMLDRLARQVVRALPARLAPREILALRDRQAPHQQLPDLQGQLVLRGIRVPQARRAFRASKGFRVIPDPRGLPEPREAQAPQVLLAQHRLRLVLPARLAQA